MNVNWQIYAYEDALELAVAGWLSKNGINDPRTQRNEQQDGSTLPTPRVEVKALFGDMQSREHYYIRPDGMRWIDMSDGTLWLKVVTRREPGEIKHSMLRGQARGLMQFAKNISSLMPLHNIQKIIEQPSAINVDEARKHDITGLQFAVTLQINPAAFAQLTS